MRNSEIRKQAKNAGLYLWQVAEAIGMRDSEFSRMLRHELRPEKKAEIQNAIAKLKEGGTNDTAENANN